MKDIKLFDYQEEIRSRIGEAFGECRAVMVQMPTGTGKTVVLASIVLSFLEKQRKPVWIVAHRRELVSQIRETIQRVFSLNTEGLSNTERTEYTDIFLNTNFTNRTNHSSLFVLHSSLIKVVSIQWLARHGEEMEERPGMIVIDEAHHALAETYRVLWERYPEAKFLGLTATPCRLNRKGFTDLFDQLVTSHTIGEFIQKGYLAPFDYVSIRPDSEEQKLVDSLAKRGADGDFQTKEMEEVLNTRPSIERLFQSFSRYAKDRKGIVYAININHARKIAEYYSEHGVGAVAIDSKTPAEERKTLIERFKASNTESTENTESSFLTTNYTNFTNTLQVLVNVDIFSEGFDCPDVEFIQLARPTLSLAKYLQMVGRGLRVAKGKGACVIMDNVGLYRMFGLPTMPWNWRAMFQGRFYRKRITDVRQMLQKGNEWMRLGALPEYERGDDPEIMVLMRHDRLMDHGKEEAAATSRTKASDDLCFDPEKMEYRILRKEFGYAVIQVGDGGCGIMRLEDQAVLFPPICAMNILLFKERTAFVHERDSIFETYVDLVSGRRFEFPFRFKLTVTVLYFGKISLLRNKNEYYTRTRKSYVTVFPIDRSDISYHGFYLLIHDPMAKRKMPVCVIEGDEEQYYWLVETLADGSICVMTEGEEYYHVRPDGTRVKSEERRVKSEERRVKNSTPGNAALPRKVEPARIGSKWGMKVDGKLFVAPIYRSITPLNEEFFAIEQLPGQWGIMNLAGKVVVEPRYVKVEMKDKYLAVLYKVNGQQEEKKLE